MFFLHLETKLVFRNSACFYRLFLLLVAKVIFPISWSIVMIKVMHKIPKGRCRFFLWNTKIAFGTLCPKISIWAMSKVENVSKVAWIWSHHLHLQWKFKLWAGKLTWDVHKGKTLLGAVNKLLAKKNQMFTTSWRLPFKIVCTLWLRNPQECNQQN